LIKIKQLVWRNVDVPEKSAKGLWSVAPSLLGVYEIHVFEGREGAFLGLPHGLSLMEHKDVLSAMDAAQAHFEAQVETALLRDDNDIVTRLGKLALAAENSSHHQGDVRLMPAAGVADMIYTAMDAITDLRAALSETKK
jgi:hypothetical protein